MTEKTHYTQEELRKMNGLPKRSWRSYFGYPEVELPQPKGLVGEIKDGVVQGIKQPRIE